MHHKRSITYICQYVDKWLSDFPINLRIKEARCFAKIPTSTRPAYSVYIFINALWDVEVNNMFDTTDIKTPWCHWGGNKNRLSSTLEVRQCFFSLALVTISVKIKSCFTNYLFLLGMWTLLWALMYVSQKELSRRNSLWPYAHPWILVAGKSNWHKKAARKSVERFCSTNTNDRAVPVRLKQIF